ncbi:MAG: RES family NAD+ phosphorylase [Nitrococcus sp.]|nr:RES family NAD+ phosphorylase [Nitrococcus sp.]
MWSSSFIARELTPLRGDTWRVAENPEAMARLLTGDPVEAPAVLLDLIGGRERDYPPECRHLHFLLKAPFERREREPPVSRFRRRRAQHRALYLAEHRETALAEFSYHQLIFFTASDGYPWPSRPRPVVVLRAHYATEHGVDLTVAPFAANREVWADPEDYAQTQAFGDAAHAATAQAIRFESVRDPKQRANVALLSCTAIDSPMPLDLQPWAAAIEPRRVTLYITLPGYPATAITFERSTFEVAGRLPRPRGHELHKT